MSKSLLELSLLPLSPFERQLKLELNSTFFFLEINNFPSSRLIPLFLFRNRDSENLELAFIRSSNADHSDFKFELLSISDSVKVKSIPERTPSETIDKILESLNLELIDEILKIHLENNMLMKWQTNFMWMLVAKKRSSFNQ